MDCDKGVTQHFRNPSLRPRNLNTYIHWHLSSLYAVNGDILKDTYQSRLLNTYVDRTKSKVNGDTGDRDARDNAYSNLDLADYANAVDVHTENKKYTI